MCCAAKDGRPPLNSVRSWYMNVLFGTVQVMVLMGYDIHFYFQNLEVIENTKQKHLTEAVAPGHSLPFGLAETQLFRVGNISGIGVTSTVWKRTLE